MKINIFTNRDPEFYAIMGPHLSRRSIVAELGDPVWDDDGKRWFLAFEGEILVGFAGLRTAGPKATFCSSYVFPPFRRRRVYSALIQARLAELRTGTTATTMARKAAQPALEKAGFVVIRETANYARMEKTIG